MPISRNILKQVLLDNQKDIEKYEILYRDFDLDSFPLQVFVGVRRSGKSYLLFQKMRMMLDAGYGWEDMLYLDFEDTRLDSFTNGKYYIQDLIDYFYQGRYNFSFNELTQYLYEDII